MTFYKARRISAEVKGRIDDPILNNHELSLYMLTKQIVTTAVQEMLRSFSLL
jgi:hypothetical protein